MKLAWRHNNALRRNSGQSLHSSSYDENGNLTGYAEHVTAFGMFWGWIGYFTLTVMILLCLLLVPIAI